ncbi:hypothetical protein SAMN05428995_103160 [Loktanella sp. DSM 29012]|uniref:hypothetical protein n=1 Tax=Loktanella sp. DSM 29012 TaxID=1881056 RepID=UPI0008AE4C37|nr:hypothetical protein [Loktanella sp. DSM 29012]SEQ18986.1 hypothetical protein SAMN05428995_103160 [Loktanella sp. DSM 29012]
MNKSLAPLTLILTLAFALSPLFSSFSGFQSDQLPIPQINPPVQPAGYAFAIWGPIYLWLTASAIYGLWKSRNDPKWDAARKPLCVSLAVGVPWLWVANQSAVWATVMIWIMLGFAIAALISSPPLTRWTFRGPVALYAGWLTAASFVSLATVLAGYGIGFSAYGWAFAGIIGALVLAMAVYRRQPAPVYLLAIIWALIGVCVNNGFDRFLITATAITGIVVLICVMAVWFPRVPAA